MFERGRRINLMVGWRLGAIGLSVMVAMAADPVGPWFFVGSLWRAGEVQLLIRLFLGILLPVLHTISAGAYLELGQCRRAWLLHAQNVIVIVLAEILAAALTFGMLGVAF
jgi:hypothetical protein